MVHTAKRIAVIVGCLSPIIPLQYTLPFPGGLQAALVIIAVTIIIAFLHRKNLAKKQTNQKLEDKANKSENKSNFCESCGKPLKPTAKFCGGCGTQCS